MSKVDGQRRTSEARDESGRDLQDMCRASSCALLNTTSTWYL